MHACKVFFRDDVNVTSACVFARSPSGSLEDWDTAVQKTESRINRVNQQRVKVRVGNHDSQHSSHRAASSVDSCCHAVTTDRLLRRKRCWLSRTRSEPSSAGRPGRRRKQLRRTFRRELELERRGRQRTGGATIQVGGGGDLRPKSQWISYCTHMSITTIARVIICQMIIVTETVGIELLYTQWHSVIKCILLVATNCNVLYCIVQFLHDIMHNLVGFCQGYVSLLCNLTLDQ